MQACMASVICYQIENTKMQESICMNALIIDFIEYQ